MLQKIYTKNAPDAIGPYSQAVIANGMLFTSGRLGRGRHDRGTDRTGDAKSGRFAKRSWNLF